MFTVPCTDVRKKVCCDTSLLHYISVTGICHSQLIWFLEFSCSLTSASAPKISHWRCLSNCHRTNRILCDVVLHLLFYPLILFCLQIRQRECRMSGMVLMKHLVMLVLADWKWMPCLSETNRCKLQQCQHIIVCIFRERFRWEDLQQTSVVNDIWARRQTTLSALIISTILHLNPICGWLWAGWLI